MAANQIDRQLIADLTAREEKKLEDQSPKSYEMLQPAIKHMPMGVASTYHARDPYPVYYTHGKGPHVWTVDGQEIADFHNGYGCMVQGLALIHISEPTRLGMISYAVFCLKKKKQKN